jgi:hypothetical protein
LFRAFSCRFLRPVRCSTVPSAREIESITLTGDGADGSFYRNCVAFTKEARHRLVAADFADITNQAFDALAEYVFHFICFSMVGFARRRCAFDGYDCIEPAWVCNRKITPCCVIVKILEKNY